MTDLKRKVGLGVAWNLVEAVLFRSATTITTLFLAAVLTPEEFGLIALTAIVFDLSLVVVNGGLAQALIRKKEVSDDVLDTAFWTNLCLAFAIYAIIYTFAEDVGRFYAEQLISDVVKVLGIGVFFGALKVVHIAILSRRMNFRTQMHASTLGALISGIVAIFLAYSDFGVWSLVCQMLLAQAISALILWRGTRWRPALNFKIRSFTGLFDFGKYLVLANLVNVCVKHSYALAIGKVFSPEAAGLYYFAMKITDLLARQFTSAVQRATLPAMSAFQDDVVALRVKYRSILKLTMFVMSPLIVGFIVMSEPLFEILFGAKWSGAIEYTQVLCGAAILYPIHALNVNVLMVLGRSDLNFGVNLVKNFVHLVVLFISLPYGVEAVVIGQVFSSLISIVPNTYYSGRLIGYGLKYQMVDLSSALFVSVLAGVASQTVRLFGVESSVAYIVLSMIVGCLSYIGLSWLVRSEGLEIAAGAIRSVIKSK